MTTLLDSLIHSSPPSNPGNAQVEVVLRARPERRFIRPYTSHRHLLFHVNVHEIDGRLPRTRLPLDLALVIDRSGSMAVEKLDMAKQAALSIVERLEKQDRVAVVVFDNQVEVIQAAALATPATKQHIRDELLLVKPGGSTALHEGWLRGCHEIAPETLPEADERLARCFLLTDGQANVGITDPGTITAQAATVRKRSRIATSTFGFGEGYNELLLGPMADQGEGQFFHLRSRADIAATFLGELGGMLAVTAARVRLDVRVQNGVSVDVVNIFRVDQLPRDSLLWSIALGDLTTNEEKRVVVRFGFPSGHGERTVSTRVAWVDHGVEHSSPWQEVTLTHAENATCDAEAYDPAVMHHVGLAHAARAQRQAIVALRSGDRARALAIQKAVAKRIQIYAGGDPVLLAAIAELKKLPQSEMEIKEAYSMSQSRSKSQLDRRIP